LWVASDAQLFIHLHVCVLLFVRIIAVLLNDMILLRDYRLRLPNPVRLLLMDFSLLFDVLVVLVNFFITGNS